MVWTKISDVSIVDQNGKVIFFSTRRFIDDICIGNCCFMRSKARGKAVQRRACFPGMALRRYNLFARTITLPNGKTTRYGRHAVPCCAECNSLMGKVVEERISSVIDRKPDSIQNFLASGGALDCLCGSA